MVFASIWYQLLHISMWASHTSIVFEMVTSKEYVHLQFLLSEKQKHLNPQSTHRVAIAGFWRRSHHGKISPVVLRVGGARPPAFSLLPSRTKLQCTLKLSGQIRSLYFISIPYMYSVPQSVIIFLDKFLCNIFPKFLNRIQSCDKIYARDSVILKVHICPEYHSVCPLVRIGTS